MSEREIQVGEVVFVSGNPIWYKKNGEVDDKVGQVVHKKDYSVQNIPYLIDFRMRGPVDNYKNSFPTTTTNVGWVGRKSINLTKSCEHNSSPVYHDVEEEWVCPFCYD